MTKPPVVVHPPIPAIEAQMSGVYEVVHLPSDRTDITAAMTIGGTGIRNEQLERLPNLKLIVGLGVGVDGLDLDYCRARTIKITNGRNINDEDVADVAIGLLIGVARYFPLGMGKLRDGSWGPPAPLAVPPQRRLRGMRLGIVSLGAIGKAIALRAEAFGMEIAWYGPRAKPDAPWRYEPDLKALATWADTLAIATPGGKATEKLINAEIIAALGEQGIVVNVSRGAVIDEDALIGALKAGKLFGAGLDVYEVEPTPPARWADVPNTMLTPHLGGGTFHALIGATQNGLENLRRFFAHEPLLTPLD